MSAARMVVREEIRMVSPLWGRSTKVSAERFELSTNGLKGRCSAIELRARSALPCEYSGLHSIMPR